MAEVVKEQAVNREAFEKAITVEGLHVNLTRIGSASSNAGEYADVIVQTCWRVWQLAKEGTEQQEERPGHDGKLDEKGEYKVFLRENGLDGQRVYVAAGDDTYIYALFTPNQSLSLLAWLEQEKVNLEQLAKEQP